MAAVSMLFSKIALGLQCEDKETMLQSWWIDYMGLKFVGLFLNYEINNSVELNNLKLICFLYHNKQYISAICQHIQFSFALH